MAYVNVADWKPDQVADWLKGLDISIHRYVESFLNNHVNGQHLLNLQPDDLEHHGIFKVGHQEIILEAVDHLRNFHYELDHENLQLLALRVSCLAHSLHRELWNSSPVVSTQTLSDISTIIKAVKSLVFWLDRPPFSGQLAYIDKKAELLRLSLEMATSGQRDRFAERPIESIRTSSKRLAELADEMIREIHDPLLLQPASLDLATLKKRPGDHLGFCIIPSFHGNHQIGEIKCNSTAYQSGKIECGDEIVQINYQTVVGWEIKQVMALFEESSSDIFLTLKKRPCHSKILGQIYMKPYRLPSKKQVSYASRWFLGDNISPPRINIRGGHFDIRPFNSSLSNSLSTDNKNKKELPESVETCKEDLHMDDSELCQIMAKEEEEEEEDDDEDNEQEEEEESISSPTSVRLYMPKPRLPVQRRATITGTGASPTSKRAPLNLEQLWHELKLEREWRLSGKQRKSDKSNSEILLSTTSPTSHSKEGNRVNFKSTKASSADCLKSVHSDFVSSKPKELVSQKHIIENESVDKEQDKDKTDDTPNANISSVAYDTSVNFIPLKERIDSLNKKLDDAASPIISVKPKIPARKFTPSEGTVSLSNSPVHRLIDKKPIARPRGKLDKSNSTPVYDLNDRTLSSPVELLKESKSLLKSKCNREDSSSPQNNSSPDISKAPMNSSPKVSNSAVPGDSSECISVSPKVSSEHPQQNITSEVINISQATSDNIERTPPPEPPKPATRTPLNNAPKTSLIINCNQINDSPACLSTIQLSTGELRISELEDEDSVFIADDDVEGGSNKRPSRTLLGDISNKDLRNREAGPGDLKYLISPERKLTNPDVSVPSPNTWKLKYIDDPESPTFSFPIRDEAPNGQSRDVSLIKEQKHSSSSPDAANLQTPVIPHSSQNVNSCFPMEKSASKDKKPALASMKQSNELMLLGSPPIKEVTRHLSEASHSSLDNRMHTSVPPSPRRDNFAISVKIDQMRLFPKPYNSNTSLSTSSSSEAVNKLHFACSTPIKKSPPETPNIQQPSTYPRKKPEMNLSSNKTSPSGSGSLNASMRAILPIKSKTKVTSPKVSRKKNNTLSGKRRNISVKDLFPSDCEGWLFQRDRKVSTVPQWVRGWFLLKGNYFYGFAEKDSSKAHLYIYLPGFTVAPAIEVKSRKYALKIYHTGTTFYLAADSQDELSTWLGCLSQAIIAHNRPPVEDISFSESEGEEKSESPSEMDKQKGEFCFTSQKVKKISTLFTGPLSSSSRSEKRNASLKKSKKDPPPHEHQGSSSLDRKYLRFLSGSNNVPVPTAQFRSYRRVPPSNLNDSLSTRHDTTAASNDSLQNRTSPPLQLPADMADYRLASMARAGHTPSRPREHNTTLEAFMISRQGEERRQNQNASALRPPQQFAPSAPVPNPEELSCRSRTATSLSSPGTSQKEVDCCTSENRIWGEMYGSASRNCNTIPDIQTKRLKKVSTVNIHARGNGSSLSEIEESSERNQFHRNSGKSSSSSKLKSFFSSSHWQDSSTKSLLGSPRLRRVLFREKSDASSSSPARSRTANNANVENMNPVDLAHAPDYPGLEYPPVFVPESYSLSYVTSILEARSNSSSNNSTHENEANDREMDEHL